MVPADARLLESRDLHVQEAALTGESLPVEKQALPVESSPDGQGDKHGKVFLGTSVVSGTAIALVTATGQSTEFGEIASRLVRRAPETEFERGTRQFGYLIMRTVVFLVLFVFLVTALLHHNPLESLLFALALAVGLTPEFLPMITTVTLGQGAVRMARQKVIVKHLEAIQNFGSIDILCSDKTGTLTSGSMALDQHLGPFGDPAERVFELAYLNSYFETGVGNPLDQAIKHTASANPLDEAILHHDHPDASQYTKVDEIPFDFERRRVSVVIAQAGARLLITKGAPESVLNVCSEYEMGGSTHRLDDEARALCEASYRGLSAKGFRILAIAYASVPQQEVYRAADEKGLVLAGFLAFSDPPLETAADALRELHKDGVRVKILTGDNELVARHVCSQVGLDASGVVLGSENRPADRRGARSYSGASHGLCAGLARAEESHHTLAEEARSRSRVSRRRHK
jgi:Mg2+-importing ATPase